ncbi:unnamed protein product [Closterium sp. Naga37s-1]|nr:unnamed protein product [Closterium sp. Naga37s-1]
MSSSATAVLTNIARLAITLGVGGSLLNASLYTVDGGHRAVLFDRFRGVLEETQGEGTHFLIPWLQKPYIFDVRTRPRSITSVTGTKDLQMVNLTLRVLSKPENTHLPTIFKTLGTDYDERVLPSIGNEVLKAVVAQFNADQLLTERPYVSKLVREALTQRAKDFNIVLDDVALTHLSYGAEFSKAVEQKQVAVMKAEHERLFPCDILFLSLSSLLVPCILPTAQQEAERSKFVVMKAEQERLAAITRAEGESEAAKLVGDGLWSRV